MQVNRVSFGKIVKVNAPYEVAKQIEDIANGKQTKFLKLNNDVKDLFNDVSSGEAHTFSFDKRTSYIFSGEEGNKYWNSRENTIEKLHETKERMKDKRRMKDVLSDIWAAHRRYVFSLIKIYGTDATLNPSTNKKNKVRIINYDV